MVVRQLKQAHLAGQTKGLRPSQQRNLEVLCHVRHPELKGADQQTLEKLGCESVNLNQPLHMVLDGRGLCRLLWVGHFDKPGQIWSYLSDLSRPNKKYLRLISCLLNVQNHDCMPDSHNAVAALDLHPTFWLRFSSSEDSLGMRAASLWQINSAMKNGWSLLKKGKLQQICEFSDSCLPLDHEEINALNIKERILLLTIVDSDKKVSERNLAELEALVRSAGGCPVAVASQKNKLHNPQTIWGKGKLQETAFLIRRYDATLVITDRELTPSQARNLERLLVCPVMDRSELILDIFAQRASSSAGRLQVELAQLRYRIPRLIGRGQSLSRQGGGIGTRGPGETQLEKDRRAILRRIDRLMRDLKQLENHRALIRSNRGGIPRVALVGYTNVGKSSLLNSLCSLTPKGRVLAEDKLFATLDPATRRLRFPQPGKAPEEILITDTVGFIRELPNSLIEAFRATLEETIAADLLLLVVDLSNPDWQLQLDAVNNLLDIIGAKSLRKVVANQIDRCDRNSLELMNRVNPHVIYVSATSGSGLKGLKKCLYEHFWDHHSAELTIGNSKKGKYE